MDCALDIFFLEAVLNGVLLAGLLALLALGLNLIFGVIDVVWICYAELVMVGMYAIFHFYKVVGLPLPLAMLLTAIGGYLIAERILGFRRRRSTVTAAIGIGLLSAPWAVFLAPLAR